MSDLSNASRDDLIKAVYSGFRKAGLSHDASLVMVGEVGRENGYQARYIFGNHSDPHNKATNSGMISWQGSRRDKLLAALSRDGVMTGNKINRSQEAIDAQTRFLVDEMKVDSPSAYSYLTSGNVDAKTGMDLVGKKFIRWRIDDPEYRQEGLNNRSYFYNLGKSLVGGGTTPPANSQGFTMNQGGNAPTFKSGGKGAHGQDLSVVEVGGVTWTVNSEYATQFYGFLSDLSATGYKLNSSGGYNDRNQRNSNKLSRHAHGDAIDIDSENNPFGTTTTNMPEGTRELAAKWGLKWGMDFKTKGRQDPMHFEPVRRMSQEELSALGVFSGNANSFDPSPVASESRLNTGSASEYNFNYSKSDGFLGGDTVQIANSIASEAQSNASMDYMLNLGKSLPSTRYDGGQTPFASLSLSGNLDPLGNSQTATAAELEANRQAAMDRAARSNVLDGSFTSLVGAHFAGSRDRFQTSVVGSAYNAVVDQGFNPGYLAGGAVGVVNSIRNAIAEAGNDDDAVEMIMSGRSPFERVDADFSNDERSLMIERFQKQTGFSMGDDYQNKVMLSNNRSQASKAYDAAYRELEIQQRMSESGIAANLGAGIISSMASPQDAPANLAGGMFLRGASALAQSARFARMAPGATRAAAAVGATPVRSVLTEGVVSGLVGAGSQSMYDTQYTIADASADVLMGAGAGLGLHGIGSGLARVAFGQTGAAAKLTGDIAVSADNAVNQARQAAVDAKVEISNRAETLGMSNPTDAVNQAQADIVSGSVKPTSPAMRDQIAIVTTVANSPELRADLEKVSNFASGIRFTRNVLNQMQDSLKRKLGVAADTEANLVERGVQQAANSQEVHAGRIKSAEDATVTAQQHLDSRVQAEAEATSGLELANSAPIEPTAKDLARTLEAETKLNKSTETLEDLGRQYEAVNASVAKLTGDMEALRRSTGDAKALDKAANTVAAEQLKAEKIKEKISSEMERAAKLQAKVDDLNSNPKEAISNRDNLVRQAQEVLNKAREQTARAQSIYENRAMEAEELKSRTLPTAEEITSSLREANAEKLSPKSPLTMEEIEELQGQVAEVDIRTIAKELGVQDHLVGNDLAGAMKRKHMHEGSQKTDKVMTEDARVASKDATVIKVNNVMSRSVLNRFNTIGTTMVSGMSAMYRNLARLGLENSSGAYGGVTAAIERENLSKVWRDRITGGMEAAYDAFSGNAGILVKYRSPLLRQKFAQVEGNLLEARLSGASNAELKAKAPEAMTDQMAQHLDNLVKTLEEINQMRWTSAGNAGKAPKLDQMPIRWNHAALAKIAENQTNYSNMRKALVESVKSSRDDRISAGRTSELTDQEIDMFVDDYMGHIFKTGNGTAFGSLSIKNREFNLWKATEEMASTGKVEINAMRSNGWKKLKDLYQSENTVSKDLSVKIELDDGRVIRLDDLTNPSATDALLHISQYNAGVIALRNIGLDVEDPKAIGNIVAVASKQGATQKEHDAFESMIAQFTGRKFKNSEPNKGLELTTSLARANMLGGLVFAQLAETANIFAHVGLVGGARILMNAPRLRRNAKILARGGKVDDILSDMAEHFGHIGVEGYRVGQVYDPNENIGFLDMMDMDGEGRLNKALRFSRSLEQFQANITLFTSLNAIMKRGVTEEYLRNTAKAVRAIQQGKTIPHLKALTSAGIDEKRLRALAQQEGVFHWDGNTFMGTSIDNITDPTLAADLIGGVRRGLGQAVQETFIGEAGTWVHSPALRFFAMFRGYMIGSIEKQLVRQVSDFGWSRFAVNALVGGLFGGAVIYSRAMLNAQFMTDEKKEEFMERQNDPLQMAQNVLQYSSQLGAVQELVNVVGAFSAEFEWTTRMGSQTGIAEWLPGFSYIEKMLKSGAGAAQMASAGTVGRVTGSNDDTRYSEKAKNVIGALPFANSTYFRAVLGRMVDDWHEEDKAEDAKDRRRADKLAY